MKDFTRPSGRLRNLPLSARVAYSVFLAFTLVALAESAWLGSDMLGSDLDGIRSYYAGEPGAALAAPARPAADGGPSLELPSDLPSTPAQDPMPLRKLLEVTHFHLFTMPVYLLILAHLFMLSRLGERHKVAWIAAGTLGVALHIAAPWAARQGGSTSALFYALTGALLVLSFLVMAAVPFYEMWWPAGGTPSR